MTLNELKYVVAVAQEGSFGEAAAACYVSKPTLSVAVKKLEEELGSTLFERRHGGICITEVGEKVIEQAKKVLAEAGTLRELAQLDTGQVDKPLRMGTIFTIGPYLFPFLIGKLAESAPEMPLIIDEHYPADLKEKLKQGVLDAVVVALPFQEQGLVTLPLYEEPFVVALPHHHPLAAKEAIEYADLQGEQILLLKRGHCFRDQVLSICPECDEREGHQGGIIEAGSLEALRYMVASGLGIAVLPCSAASMHRLEELVTIKPFAGESPTRTVALAWRKSFPRSKAITAVREALIATQAECLKLDEE